MRALGDSEPEAVARAIAALGERGDAAALPALEALYDDRLRVGPDGSVFVDAAQDPDAAPATRRRAGLAPRPARCAAGR